MIINRYRQDSLGLILPDNVFIQELLYLLGFDQFEIGEVAQFDLIFLFLLKDLLGLSYALVANMSMDT